MAEDPVKNSEIQLELELAKKHLPLAKEVGLDFSLSCMAMKRVFDINFTEFEEESLELYERIKNINPQDLSLENILKYSKAIRRFSYYSSPLIKPENDTESKELNCYLSKRSPFCGEDYV